MYDLYPRFKVRIALEASFSRYWAVLPSLTDGISQEHPFHGVKTFRLVPGFRLYGVTADSTQCQLFGVVRM